MLNRIVLEGRLTRDVDIKQTNTGVTVGNFTLAVARNIKNAQGSYDTDFINCTVWRNGAETLAKFTHKGSLISVEGRLQSDTYQNQDGNNVTTFKVNVDNFNFLDTKNSNQSNTSNTQMSNNRPSVADPYAQQATGKDIDISDNDLPF